MKTTLLKILKEIKANPDVKNGICRNITYFFKKMDVDTSKYNLVLRIFCEIVEKWPGYSGRKVYPIKGLILSSHAAFNVAYSYGTLWSKWSIYGRRRRALLQFCIDTLEKELLLEGKIAESLHIANKALIEKNSIINITLDNPEQAQPVKQALIEAGFNCIIKSEFMILIARNSELTNLMLKMLKSIKKDPYHLFDIYRNFEIQTNLKIHLFDHTSCENCFLFLSLLIRSWPKYSGVIGYPVPNENPNYSPIDAYFQAEAERTLWSKNTEYGKLRWELLDFCIDKLERMLK